MILVDGIKQYEAPRLQWKNWSHMVSTVSLEDLMAFANKLGLKTAWLQRDPFAHFDIVPAKRKLAVSLGAVEVNSRLLLFGNFDYAGRRPNRPVPLEYARQLVELERSADRHLLTVAAKAGR